MADGRWWLGSPSHPAQGGLKPTPAMERWEYQVIHLNVEASAPAPPAAPTAPPPSGEPATGTPPIRAEAVFSKEYLEKEFPGFYGAAPPAGAGASAREHPANQLRGFLNLQGRDGWQLLGIYPVGQLQMMIFRRPLAPAPVGGEPPTSATTAPPADSEDAAAAAPVQPEPSPPPCVLSPSQEQGVVLNAILSRLEALERRLPAPSAAATPPPPQSAPQQLNAATGLQDGEILPLERWGSLETLPRLSTPEAARALGFRSAASLLNLAARSGYRDGLVKRGGNGAVAVYVGSEKSGRGGRDRRLWVVLPAVAPA